MSNEHIISLLIAERDKLDRAIESLQGSAKRRGRPPRNQSPAAVLDPPKKKRRTAAQRKAQAERMKAYWADKRKREAKR